MSKIRLHGSSSGHTDVAPAAAAGNNTVTLPNSAGTLLLTDGSAASLTQIPAANIVGVCTAGFGNASGAYSQGITHSRVYRITSSYTLTSGSATLTANWEYEDNASAGNLGSDWSLPSSGVFSFPTTGIYMVKGHTMFSAVAGTNTPYGGLSIQGTTDNFSSIDYRTDAYSSQEYDDFNQTRYHNVHLGAMFDVTDTSNVKFKLLAYRDVNYGNISFAGSSDHNYTYVEVIRLGDT